MKVGGEKYKLPLNGNGRMKTNQSNAYMLFVTQHFKPSISNMVNTLPLRPQLLYFSFLSTQK